MRDDVLRALKRFETEGFIICNMEGTRQGSTLHSSLIHVSMLAAVPAESFINKPSHQIWELHS